MNYAPKPLVDRELPTALPSGRKQAVGRLIGIATKAAHKGPMTEVGAARITVERGVDDDVRGKPGPRQVTVLVKSGWDAACAELGAGPLSWTARRANLLVEGIELRGKVGLDLQVGDALLAITGETRPCQRMNQAQPGLRPALEDDWRGGVTCRVVRSGDIAVGCDVTLGGNGARRWLRIGYLAARRTIKTGRRTLAGVARRLGLKKKKAQKR